MAFALVLTLFLSGCGQTVVTPADPVIEPEPPSCADEPEPPACTTATLAVCGDVMTHLPLTNAAWDEEQQRYNFLQIMEAARPWIERADYAVANLETTMSGGPPYSGYPAFNAPDDLAYDLKEIGFDLMLTANNHSLDRGWSGVQRTLDILDTAGLAHVGTSRTQEEFDNGIVVANVGRISIAFLGYTYGTNGIPLPKAAPFAVNVYNIDYLTHLAQPDYERLQTDLDKAAALNTDLVAVMIHWGLEYKTEPSIYQEEVAEFLVAHGADLVLGGHSHVPQPLELLTVIGEDGEAHSGFVCYSLGNFISAQNDPLTDTTAVLTLELTKNNVTGEASVTGCDYAPMLMLDRGKERPPRFELLDANAVAGSEVWSEDIRSQSCQAAVDCVRILGDPAALTAAMNGRTEVRSRYDFHSRYAKQDRMSKSLRFTEFAFISTSQRAAGFPVDLFTLPW